MYPNIHSRTIYKVKIQKQLKCPSTEQWIKMMWYIYSEDVVHYSATKKNEIMPFAATWMGLEIIILSKSERKTNIIQYYLWWNLKDKTNEPIYNRNRLTNIENRLLFASGEVNGGGMDREVGISRYEVFYTQWINKVLLYSTENHIQYPQISHSEKEYKKECINIYICITESLCRTADINTTL